jgi:hypothetical protein
LTFNFISAAWFAALRRGLARRFALQEHATRLRNAGPSEMMDRAAAAAKGLRQLLAVLGVVAGLVPAPGYMRVRCSFFVFGVLLGLGGIWGLIPVLLCPEPAGLPRHRNLAEAGTASSTRAFLAAEIAAVRGDLWAAAAFEDARVLWQDFLAGPGDIPSQRFDKIRARAEKALAYAPVNGAAWLLLAILPQNSPNADSRISTLLELSYFTAPNDVRLAPIRVMRAAASNLLASTDIHSFIKSDIRGILNRLPNSQKDLIAAYRNAWPQNQPIFAALLAEIDPALATSLSLPQSK